MSWRPLGPVEQPEVGERPRPAPARGEEPAAQVRFVTPGLFDALGVRVYRGRDFAAQDAAGAPTVAVVNRRFAEVHWPGQDPIGKRLSMEWFGDHVAEVVGVVADVRLTALDTAATPTIYWSHAQIPGSQLTYVVESQRPMASLEPELRRTLASLDPGLALLDAEPLDRTLWESVARPVFTTSVATAFSALALLLAAVGLFGIMARYVGDRRPELAVRLALGAKPADVVKIVLREALTLALPGALVGFVGAIALGGVMSNQLFGTSPTEPLVHLAAVAIVVMAAMATALLPAIRASRVQPALVLRGE
jgi:putative ABC transport system permease protein